MFSFQEALTESGWNPPDIRVEVHPPSPRPDYDVPQELMMKRAQDILDREAANLRAFCQSTRQQVKLSGLEYFATRREMTQVVMSYQFNTGQELIRLDVYPEYPRVQQGGLRLLVFYSEHKILAVDMKQLEFTQEEGPPESLTPDYQADLTGSNWGEELLRAAQFKFSADDDGVLLSAINVTPDNIVERGETHYFANAKNEFRVFVAASSLSQRTPFLNGSTGTYYGPLDVFNITEDGPVYGGASGNGNIPVAVAADGTRYYKASITADMFTMHTYEIQEYERLDALQTDEDLLAFIDSLEVGYPFYSIGGAYIAPWLSSTGYNDLYVATQTAGELIRGAAGYGVHDGAAFTPVYKIATTDANAGGGGLLEIRSDLATDIPMTVFSQVDELDVLAVELAPATAELHYNFFNPGGYTTIGVTAQFLHMSYSMYKPAGSYVAGTPYHPFVSNDWVQYAPYYRTWLITFPPSLSLEEGGYYFANNGEFRTPYEQLTYTMSPPSLNNAYIMRDVYRAWFHLSNGKIYMQGFELNDRRRIYCNGVDITSLIEAVCGVGISDVQGCLIDFPLKRARDLK